MSQGRIEQIGGPREIYERPANAFVADFVGSSNLLDAAVIATEPDATVIRTDRGLRLRAERCSAAAGDRVIAMVRPERIRLLAAPETTGDNSFAARIRQATYLGQDLHVSLDVDGKQELTAVTRAGAARRLAAGDEVAVAVDAADIFLLRR
jgi:ABC-type Fe3+/spermidine/putrescine transport system ATPase subunit